MKFTTTIFLLLGNYICYAVEFQDILDAVIKRDTIFNSIVYLKPISDEFSPCYFYECEFDKKGEDSISIKISVSCDLLYRDGAIPCYETKSGILFGERDTVIIFKKNFQIEQEYNANKQLRLHCKNLSKEQKISNQKSKREYRIRKYSNNAFDLTVPYKVFNKFDKKVFNYRKCDDNICTCDYFPYLHVHYASYILIFECIKGRPFGLFDIRINTNTEIENEKWIKLLNSIKRKMRFHSK